MFAGTVKVCQAVTFFSEPFCRYIYDGMNEDSLDCRSAAVQPKLNATKCVVLHQRYIIQSDSFGTRPKKMRISQRLFIIQFNIL
jgi:hypothetical protein